MMKKKLKFEFDPEKTWSKLTDEQKTKFEELKKKFIQVPRKDLLYIYKNRTDALLLCENCLDEPRRAGKDWIFFATGKVKQYHAKCVDSLSRGTPLYQWLRLPVRK